MKIFEKIIMIFSFLVYEVPLKQDAFGFRILVRISGQTFKRVFMRRTILFKNWILCNSISLIKRLLLLSWDSMKIFILFQRIVFAPFGFSSFEYFYIFFFLTVLQCSSFVLEGKIPNSSIQPAGDVDVMQSKNVTCDNGYTLNGTSKIVCLEDQTFSTLPTCEGQ